MVRYSALAVPIAIAGIVSPAYADVLDFSKLDFGREVQMTVDGKDTKYCIQGPVLTSPDGKYAILELDDKIYSNGSHDELLACIVDKDGHVLDRAYFNSNFYDSQHPQVRWLEFDGNMQYVLFSTKRIPQSPEHSDQTNESIGKLPEYQNLRLKIGPAGKIRVKYLESDLFE